MKPSFKNLPSVCEQNSEMPLWGSKLTRMDCKDALRTCAKIEELIGAQPPEVKDFFDCLVTLIVRTEYDAALIELQRHDKSLDSVARFDVALLKAQLRALCGDNRTHGTLYSAALTVQGAALEGSLNSPEMAPDLFRAEALGALGAIKCTRYLDKRCANPSDETISKHFSAAIKKFSELAPNQQSEALVNMVVMTRALNARPVDSRYSAAIEGLREQLAPLILESIQAISSSPEASATDRFRARLIKVLCTRESQMDSATTIELDRDVEMLFEGAQSSLSLNPTTLPTRPEATFGEVQLVAEMCRNRGHHSDALALYDSITSHSELTKTQHRRLLIDAYIGQIVTNHALWDIHAAAERPDLTRDLARVYFHGDSEACAEIEIAWAKCLRVSAVSGTPDTVDTLREFIAQQIEVLRGIRTKCENLGLYEEAKQLFTALGGKEIQNPE